VRLGRVVLVVLALIAIASVVRAQFRQPDAAPDPSNALTARTAVPAPVMATLRLACFDCHSNETRWPWYSRLPIVSWLIEQDVRDGRGQLNFSRWGEYNPFDRAGLLDKVCELTTARKMPLPRYLTLHHDARLTQPDLDQLCAWTEHEATRLVQGGS
jgi:hypothetical protein